MRYFTFLAFAIISSLFLSVDSAAEPEVTLVTVEPDIIDNQQEEEVYFNADCSVCNGEGLTYFYWNSSIDGVLSQGSGDHNVILSSSDFSQGEHTISFQVRDNNSQWSEHTEDSRATISVSGRDDGDGSISVNFDLQPPVAHLGENINFRACSEMYPEPQPCVDDTDADLEFNWEVLWNNEGEWEYIGNSESFSFTNLQEGTHSVRLTISYQEETANAVQEFIVLPPIPVVTFNFTSGDLIKEGENLAIGAECFDNNQLKIECEYTWEVWDNDDNPNLLFVLSGSQIVVSNLTNSVGSYEFILRSKSVETNVSSSYYDFIVNVLPPNQNPTASITINPSSLGGITPEYYQFSVLTFVSTSSDPDGDIITYKWYFNNEVVSQEQQFSRYFNESGEKGIIYQVKLEVQDDNGVWSSQTATNFKIIPNSAPVVDFTYSSESSVFTFNSSSSDAEGSISSFNWLIDGLFYSNQENITWSANKTGTYTISLEVTDDGGMTSTVSKDIYVKIAEMKNFLVYSSNKSISVGDIFELDFSKTTGDVDYFNIKVIYQNGTSVNYKVTDRTVNFSLKFDEAGTYPIDVTVVWEDGTERGLEDFYGPTVVVRSDENNSSNQSTVDELPIEESDDLSSLSLLVCVFILSLIAVSRRQR